MELLKEIKIKAHSLFNLWAIAMIGLNLDEKKESWRRSEDPGRGVGNGMITGVTLTHPGTQSVTVEVANQTTGKSFNLSVNGQPTLGVSVSGAYTVGSTLTADVSSYSDPDDDADGTHLYQC
jgi:hypothetical protein